MTRIALDIDGMTCAACATRVEKVLSRVEGVTKAEVNLALERASVDSDRPVEIARLLAAVDKAGYSAIPRAAAAAERRRQDEARAAARRAEERQTLLRVIVSALLTIPLLVGTLPMMLGIGEAWIGPWTQAALAAGVMAVSGTRFWREAYLALRGGGANMAVLVSIGTSAAFLHSLWLVLFGHGHEHLTFESAAVVLTLVMLGKYLEVRAKGSASGALQALASLRPSQAEKVDGDALVTVPVETLLEGDVLRVRPGARIPADGTILHGASAIDESLVTGESLPVDKGEGASVLTGTINGDGVLDIKVAAIGDDTRIARMTRLIEDAQIAEAPVQKLVDRISAIFVPVILAIALLTWIGWLMLTGDGQAGLSAAIAVLVIACPCALGLATPTALVAGTGAAARAGILIRNIETLEKAEAVRTVAFDKTGTLTMGEPRVVSLAPLDMPEDALLRLAAALEAGSEHPLARALVREAEARSIALPAASGVRAVAGKGLTGTVEGRSVAVGNAALLANLRIEAPNARASGSEAAGTTAHVVIDGRDAGSIGFADEARPEAAATIETLKRSGHDAVMLTGDNAAAARAIAAELGIDDVRAGLLPDEKLDAIRAIRKNGPVAFVGDGLNDGPALAAADLGIALASGTDLAREAAAVTLMRPDLTLVPAAFEIARRTRRTIATNLAWAFVYNLVGIPLAVAGILSPVFAGAAMAFSSVSVVTNSARLARWKPQRGEDS